ncbi:MAG: hypothetical protein E7050_00160 [Lentisphaerae bacterium]|nr:hypothetical protein [Lentisphaerota bacterium]
MNKKFFVLALTVLTAFAVSAGGFRDPDFELSPAGQLKKWSGGSWILLTAKDIKAEIVTDASKAFSGKQYLHISNPDKNPISVGGFPRITVQPGKRYILSCRLRGTGKVSIMFIRNDKNLKGRPWDPKCAARRIQLTPDQWTEMTLSYVPQAEDFKMYVAVAVREGDADVDGFTLKIEDIDAPASAQ